MHCTVQIPAHDASTVCQDDTGHLEQNPPLGCHHCPCKPKSHLNPSGVGTRYVTELCRQMQEKWICGFKRAALVGFGIATLSTCLSEACPSMPLVTVDIDPGAEQVGRMFFGWRNQSEVLNMDAKEYLFKHRNTFDLIMVDCFIRSAIAPACKTPEFFKAARHSWTPKATFFMNTLKANKKTQANILRGLQNDGKSSYRFGQWFVVTNDH